MNDKQPPYSSNLNLCFSHLTRVSFRSLKRLSAPRVKLRERETSRGSKNCVCTRNFFDGVKGAMGSNPVAPTSFQVQKLFESTVGPPFLGVVCQLNWETFERLSLVFGQL